MAKTPRFDPYLKLVFRLFEALYLLGQLGRVRGPQLVAAFDSSILARRRRFLKNLAFLCDYLKGGPSSTALAVEDRADRNVFWISSNAPEDPSKDTRGFLESVITAAKNFHRIPDDQKARAEYILTRKCVEFASVRVKKEAHGVSSSAKKCRLFLEQQLAHKKGEKPRACKLGQERRAHANV